MKRRRPAVKLTLSPDAHRLFRERAKTAGVPRSQYLETLLFTGRAPVFVPRGAEASLTMGKGCEVRGAVFEGSGTASITGGAIIGLHPAYGPRDAVSHDAASRLREACALLQGCASHIEDAMTYIESDGDPDEEDLANEREFIAHVKTEAARLSAETPATAGDTATTPKSPRAKRKRGRA